MSKGDRLKAIRESLGYKQSEMADKLGIERSSLSRMEQDKSGLSEQTLILLAEMGININWFLTGSGTMLAADANIRDSELIKELEDRINRIKSDTSDAENTLRKIKHGRDFK